MGTDGFVGLDLGFKSAAAQEHNKLVSQIIELEIKVADLKSKFEKARKMIPKYKVGDIVYFPYHKQDLVHVKGIITEIYLADIFGDNFFSIYF